MVTVSAAIALGASRVGAQTGPVFELQPGITVMDFISVPEETPSNSGFSLRFSTRFPTAVKWLTPVAGAYFFPYGTTENTTRNNEAPSLFVGNVFPVISAGRTAGWFSIELPILLTHSPGAGPTGAVRDYGKDLVILPTVNLHIGDRALHDFGSVWSRLKIVAQIEQVMTPNRDATTGNRDYFNPTATFGIALTIGGQRN